MFFISISLSIYIQTLYITCDSKVGHSGTTKQEGRRVGSLGMKSSKNGASSTPDLNFATGEENTIF